MPRDEPKRSAWSVGMWDDWDVEKSEALRRTRDALALQPVQEPRRAEERPEVAPAAISEPVLAPVAFSRREKVAQLVARVQAGDLSAVAALRELLGA